ncbi:hypothetical protein EON67_12135 [archaeon]|nr:MAG: hypothetical protein EON67_12135 [archaeon]
MRARACVCVCVCRIWAALWAGMRGACVRRVQDHGAYYYYNLGPYANYLDMLMAVYNYSQSAGIPYKAVLLDSWWCVRAGGAARRMCVCASAPRGCS